MSGIYIIRGFYLTKCKYGEIQSKTCAIFVRNEYTVFGVALRSAIPIFLHCENKTFDILQYENNSLWEYHFYSVDKSSYVCVFHD